MAAESLVAPMADLTTADIPKATFTVAQSITFSVDPKYEVLNPLGKGAYGTVCKGKNTETGEAIAIKRISPVFAHPIDAKRTLRELKILNLLKHENIICLKDIMVIPPKEMDTYDEIYVVTDLMDTDLYAIIKSPQELNESHYKYFMYQLLKGLKYLHSANCLHRDLKPSNLLLNADSELKICDFGLSRVDDLDTGAAGSYTEYVVTRWYRAPEVICDRKAYGKPVDMWAAGTIFAEMLGRKVLLPGRDQVHQLALTVELVGTPTPDETAKIMNTNARRYVENYKKVPRKNFQEIFPDATAEALDLLDKMLVWDPAKRWTAEQCLEHPFLEDYRDAENEPSAPCEFLSFDFEGQPLDIETIRRLIFNEMLLFHPEVGTHVASTADAELALTNEEREKLDAAMADAGDAQDEEWEG